MPSSNSQDQMRIDRLHKQKLDFKKLYLTFQITFSKTFSWSFIFFLYKQFFFKNFPLKKYNLWEPFRNKHRKSQVLNLKQILYFFFFKKSRKAKERSRAHHQATTKIFILILKNNWKTIPPMMFVLLFQFLLFSNISCIETKLT